MPILDLQRRLREAGRIRIGQKVPTGKGKTRPEKLDRFRLTSADRDVIDVASHLYGGEPKQWTDAPVGDQWEVILDTAVLPVVVPPAATVMSQWYEQWSGGGCVRRCDGETEVLHNTPCVCNLEDERTCKPTTRLNVILADLPGLGVWRLESHGWYAATELAGTVEVCLAAATRGQLLPAVLRLEQRQVKRVGEPNLNFAVPVLDVQMTPVQLGITVGSPPALATRGLGEPVDGSWQSIPAARTEPAGLPAGVMAAAAAEPGNDGPKPRKNSPPALPSTGVKPKGYKAPVAAIGDPFREPVTPIEPAVTQKLASDGITPAQMRMMQASFNGAGIIDREERLAFTRDVIKRDIATSKDLTVAEASTIIDWLRDITPASPEEPV